MSDSINLELSVNCVCARLLVSSPPVNYGRETKTQKLNYIKKALIASLIGSPPIQVKLLFNFSCTCS
ncbi:hypothetical protein MIMGU_mgv1a017567mg [Erythranthe guttata]|uniref:Uncharacterized protein n=1 Tax=Erythranthe guttata TaxID=4155 RepID=A0A022QCA4_ERYGU|nr:hypothetical protein MIMGU_mgv1a017567mg [Erythranthe guttata]